MRYLTVLFLFAFSIGTFAQTKTPKYLIADETEMSFSKSSIKIVTSAPKIIDILTKTSDEGKLLRANIAYKKDRMGRYALYSFFYKTEDAAYVEKLIRSFGASMPDTSKIKS